MTPKKYKLLRDLPDYKAGEIFFYNEYGYYEATTKDEIGVAGKWPPKYVENNPKWFEEVKEPERIEAGITGFDITAPAYRNDLYTSHPIPAEKFPAIKKAIEQVLNGEYDPDKKPSFFTPKSLVEKMYTQSEYNKGIEEAFEAAKLKHPWAGMKYETFKEYQATLKK